MELTNIELQAFDPAPLQERAAAIRDAVANKAITPAMVARSSLTLSTLAATFARLCRSF